MSRHSISGMFGKSDEKLIDFFSLRDQKLPTLDAHFICANVASEKFISTAKRIQAGADVKFHISMEGDINEVVSVVHEHGVDESIMKKVHFFRGDACALSGYADNREDFGTFDGVILANLLCRLPDPRACLEALPKIVNPGGVVVIVTPFSWLEGTMATLILMLCHCITLFAHLAFSSDNRFHPEERVAWRFH